MHQVIVLNGGSSSGKTTIAWRLQELLPDAWQRVGIDDLVDEGVAYDLEVDTTSTAPIECARLIAELVT